MIWRMGMCVSIASMLLGAQPPARQYESKTISIRLVPDEHGRTAVFLREYGDSDTVIIEAFYYTDSTYGRLLLHKEATSLLAKGVDVGTDIDLPLDKIELIRVKELKLKKQSEFGKVRK